MQRYRVARDLGDGAFGTVSLATHTPTGDKVAIKRMKKRFATWDECVQLREVKSLTKLVHPNIVRLREVIREHERLYFVFEYLESNLLEAMRARMAQPPLGATGGGFTDAEVRWIIFQVLLGLAYMHKHNYFHRDLKPENLLMASGPALITKLADFGLARELRSRPPFTDYISTRWYRAPELLLRSPSYSSPIDLWALGCIMAELYAGKPLFPGSTEIDQVFRIATVLGPFTSSWRDATKLAANLQWKLPITSPTGLAAAVPGASHEALNLMGSMLAYDPGKRPSAAQALSHPYFAPILASVRLDADFMISSGHVALGSQWINVQQTPGTNDSIPRAPIPVAPAPSSPARRYNRVSGSISGSIGDLRPPPAAPQLQPTSPSPTAMAAESSPIRSNPHQHVDASVDELLDDLESLTRVVPPYLPAIQSKPVVAKTSMGSYQQAQKNDSTQSWRSPGVPSMHSQPQSQPPPRLSVGTTPTPGFTTNAEYWRSATDRASPTTPRILPSLTNGGSIASSLGDPAFAAMIKQTVMGSQQQLASPPPVATALGVPPVTIKTGGARQNGGTGGGFFRRFW